ncbi:endonuclease domain-containing protein [Microvirga pudoricolor]|uniref:endonuclease domain-containing protein n=1 Tax=Microvirga pudoricolor TaxID=2778729 RepID=UPI001951BCD9|nr:endonuclease domain-containing protein [Microvirga pudoricolor]MBM6594179.1 endonuclease domain-containing protein [Microvirga pudoricolor]
MVIKKNNVTPSLRSFANEQRSIPTRAEDLFWQQVRAGRFHGYKFKRQVPITPYIADFLCAAARLIVEFDGVPHERPEQQAHEMRRDAFLRAQGFRVLRFSNDLMLGNGNVVLDSVRQAIEAELGPSPDLLRRPPSPAEGRGEEGTA